MLFFAGIWLAIDLFAMHMVGAVGTNGDKDAAGFVVAFFAIHLFPVYLYVGGVLFSGLRAKNTYYVLTDRAVYFQSGIFTASTEREPLKKSPPHSRDFSYE